MWYWYCMVPYEHHHIISRTIPIPIWKMESLHHYHFERRAKKYESICMILCNTILITDHNMILFTLSLILTLTLSRDKVIFWWWNFWQPCFTRIWLSGMKNVYTVVLMYYFIAILQYNIFIFIMIILMNIWLKFEWGNPFINVFYDQILTTLLKKNMINTSWMWKIGCFDSLFKEKIFKPYLLLSWWWSWWSFNLVLNHKICSLVIFWWSNFWWSCQTRILNIVNNWKCRCSSH